MKIVIIGASGTVGRAVTEELSRRHEVISVGRRRAYRRCSKRSARWMRLSPPAVGYTSARSQP
ncbi:short chain dehydrogenase [Enterobacter hormaechei]|nr:short chain dehydrogenase [Enterobacter hormaechei]